MPAAQLSSNLESTPLRMSIPQNAQHGLPIIILRTNSLGSPDPISIKTTSHPACGNRWEGSDSKPCCIYLQSYSKQCIRHEAKFRGLVAQRQQASFANPCLTNKQTKPNPAFLPIVYNVGLTPTFLLGIEEPTKQLTTPLPRSVSLPNLPCMPGIH